MPKEIILVKVNNGFSYATDADREIAEVWKLGQSFKVPMTQQSPRSLAYHKRYWGGLLSLTLQYWQPDSAMTTEAEAKHGKGLLPRIQRLKELADKNK